MTRLIPRLSLDGKQRSSSISRRLFMPFRLSIFFSRIYSLKHWGCRQDHWNVPGCGLVLGFGLVNKPHYVQLRVIILHSAKAILNAFQCCIYLSQVLAFFNRPCIFGCPRCYHIIDICSDINVTVAQSLQHMTADWRDISVWWCLSDAVLIRQSSSTCRSRCIFPGHERTLLTWQSRVSANNYDHAMYARCSW